MKIYVALISSLLLASPALAQASEVMSGSGAALEGGSGDAPEGSSTSGVNDDGERRICRRVETDTSSRMTTRRVCLTAREWRQQQQQQRN